MASLFLCCSAQLCSPGINPRQYGAGRPHIEAQTQINHHDEACNGQRGGQNLLLSGGHRLPRSLIFFHVVPPRVPFPQQVRSAVYLYDSIIPVQPGYVITERLHHHTLPCIVPFSLNFFCTFFWKTGKLPLFFHISPQRQAHDQHTSQTTESAIFHFPIFFSFHRQKSGI